VAWLPASFNEPRPRRRINDARDGKSASVLERFDGHNSAIGERADWINKGSVTEAEQSLLKFTNAGARGTTLQVAKVQGLN
jgi:hypothetical protein